MANPFPLRAAIARTLLILFGVAFVSIGLEMFLSPHKILPGGIKGIAILLSHVTEMKLGLILLYINLPFIVFKRRNLQKTISALAVLAITTLLTLLMHPIPPLVDHPLLASLFGGIIFGSGVGLIVRYGWYVDGVQALAVYFKKKVRLSIDELLMIVNLFILSCGGWYFGWDQAMYSVIAYFTAYRAIQFTLQYNTRKPVRIATEMREELTTLLFREFGKDIDFLTSSSQSSTDLFLIVSSKNANKLSSIVHQLDPSANVEISSGIPRRRKEEHPPFH